MYQVKLKFWLGFEAMEKLAKEQGLESFLPTELYEASPARKPRSWNV